MVEVFETTKREIYSWEAHCENEDVSIHCYSYLTKDFKFLYQVDFVHNGGCIYQAYCSDTKRLLDTICDQLFIKALLAHDIEKEKNYEDR